jgi:hypothetical protein
VAQWLAGLKENWPQREEVMAHIARQIEALPFPQPQVVELATGPGLLAEFLLAKLPQISYTGLDFSELLLTVAQERLEPFKGRSRLIRVDLNRDEWLAQVSNNNQAIISMQSLHDLGGEPEVDRIYGLAQTLLVPGGLFLNADLVTPPGQDKPDNPGRRSIPRHLELLKAHGYERVACTLALGDFACMIGFAPRF